MRIVELPPGYLAGPLLGVGGMGEVWRVTDLSLDRTCALKVLRAELADQPELVRRFREEARVTAGLSHPGIVPVFSIGELPDGRPFFTMGEVKGRGLDALIAELHAAVRGGVWRTPRSGLGLRRGVELVLRAAEAVAYAHARGVLHRDLKPGNLVVGAFGELVVLDWGLAGAGAEAGSPDWMPPEGALPSEATDAYGLGAVLLALLTGAPPAQAAPVPAPVDPRLLDLCAAALQADPDRRPPVAAFVRGLAAALQDASRREEGLRLVEEADALGLDVEAARQRAARLFDQAAARLDAIPTWMPEAEKLDAWALEEAARAEERASRAAGVQQLQRLRGALNADPSLPEAHARLADLYQAQVAAAEAREDGPAAEEALELLVSHDQGAHVEWIDGAGALSLVTDPPGATVELLRYEPWGRRLVPQPVQTLGPTPIHAHPLPRGSYLLRIHHPGRRRVDYPVEIGRLEHWDGRPPGAAEPLAIALPAEDALGPDEVYVPAGWAWTGAVVAETETVLPRRRVWLPAFVMQRFACTLGEVLDWLNAQVAAGAADAALAHCPRWPQKTDLPLFERDANGFFALPTEPDAEGDLLVADAPAFGMRRRDAIAMAGFLAARTGRPCRLPTELEWEKAARGVDGRPFPWGRQNDASFMSNALAQSGPPRLPTVREFPLDESPFGLRGMAGTLRSMTADPFRVKGPPVSADGRVLPDVDAGDGAFVSKGGAWAFRPRYCRADTRYTTGPGERRADTGHRFCFDVPGLLGA